MTEAFFENETFTNAATGRIPLGRILTAEEIAGAIVFLASPFANTPEAGNLRFPVSPPSDRGRRGGGGHRR
jgi:NAD(P)-dependent dehydrogenase (short-subunit alcohol dehydrogenase family)